MKMAPECRTCILKQAVTAAKISGADDALISRILTRSRELLDAAPEGIASPEAAADIYRMIAELTGNPDPYRSQKKKSTEEALAVLPRIQEMVLTSPDPLRLTLLAAAAGNIIDFGVPSQVVSPREIFDQIDELRFHHDDLSLLEEDLRSARTILYLADNAGELVFDRLFFDYAAEHFPAARITLAVRGGPVINDATREDARESEIDDRIELIDTGCAVPGALLSRASGEFLKVFHESDVVISKGQGNFEVLDGVERPVYFIFKVKCDCVSEYLKVPGGSLMLLKNRPDLASVSPHDADAALSR